jgi:sporulation protein YlmC with PRC-barrel domain
MSRKTTLAAAVLAASGVALSGAALGAPTAVDHAATLYAQAEREQTAPDAPAAIPGDSPRIEEQQPGEPAVTDPMVEIDPEHGETLRVGALRGMRVQNAAGEDIGRIDDVVLDRDGSVSYVALSYGGVFGFGDKLFAVPWEEVQFVPEEPHVVVNLSRETLDRLEGFDKANWPDQPEFAAFEAERQPAVRDEAPLDEPSPGVVEPDVTAPEAVEPGTPPDQER